MRFLPDAVPPLLGEALSDARYAIVSRGLPRPERRGVYLAEACDDGAVRLIAYIDPHARAFATDAPLDVPPAREPDLQFMRFDDQPDEKIELGCVSVRDGEGGGRIVACYRRNARRDTFDLFNTWYRFEPHDEGLSFDEALARAYLAFVHRPALGAPAVPLCGLDAVDEALRSAPPLAALQSVCALAQVERVDAQLEPPALVRLLAEWLNDAGLEGADRVADERRDADDEDDPFRLVRTARYADLYYLALADDDVDVPVHAVWALEAALNRYELVRCSFGDLAPMATEAHCAFCDDRLRALIATQVPQESEPLDAAEPDSFGEWAVRIAIAVSVESLRLPYRCEVLFRANASAGVVAFALEAPDARLMPARVWDDAADAWREASSEERRAEALAYAQRVGTVLAASAFKASRGIETVSVVARAVRDVPLDGARADTPEGSAFYHVVIDRATFSAHRCEAVQGGDVAPLFAACHALVGTYLPEALADPFRLVDDAPEAAVRRRAPEVASVELTERQQRALGARDAGELRIDYDAQLSDAAETLAEKVSDCATATEATRIVRAMQDETLDPRVFEACTRLMTALAEGSVNMDAPADVAACFKGEDRLAQARARAREVVQTDAEAAVEILRAAVAEAEANGRFADNAETVHRAFGDYAARVLYNRLRADGVAHPDAGKRVEVAPFGLVLCYCDLMRLLEGSFDQTDEALRYGQRAAQLAPTSVTLLRLLGRAYMLTGDMGQARDALVRALSVAVDADEISGVYYQLAYVEWKAGRAQAGVACYLKSLETSDAYAVQALAELRDLLDEPGARMMERSEIATELQRFGLPVAPLDRHLACLEEAAEAAVDAGLFNVARTLLHALLRFRPDDALANVLRSCRTD